MSVIDLGGGHRVRLKVGHELAHAFALFLGPHRGGNVDEREPALAEPIPQLHVLAAWHIGYEPTD
jgi:hypothetical protein